MADIQLNEKIKMKINTFEEAAALRGFLVERKYKEIRIGKLYLESTYRNEKEALSGGEGIYEVKYDGVSADVTSDGFPYPVPTAPVAPSTPIVPTAPVVPSTPIVPTVPVAPSTPTVPVMPLPVIPTGVELDPLAPPIPADPIGYVPFGTGISAPVDKRIQIDVENVLEQLEDIKLEQKNMGDFVTVDWKNRIRAVAWNWNEIVEMKFLENGSDDFDWDERILCEWIKIRGNKIHDIEKYKEDYGIDVGDITKWCGCFYKIYENGEDKYKVIIDFWHSDKFLDANVSIERTHCSYDDNWLDPDIEEAMILGGCWD